MARHSFSGAAVATTLSSNINSSVTAIPVNTLSGTWPNTAIGPFVVTLDRGTASEEKILVSAYTPTQLTCTRGYDGTTAVSHGNGATCEHSIDATQLNLWDSVVAGVGTTTPSNSAVGDVAADGSAVTTPAAGDHVHGREAFATSSTNSAVGDAESAGTATTVAHGDHKHGRESFYGSVGAVSTSAGSVGSSTSPAHGDHVHQAGGQIIGLTSYAPAVMAQYNGSTSGLVALDATNLKVTFVAPASGDVLVRLTGYSQQEGSGVAAFALLDGSNTKYGPTAEVPNNGQGTCVTTTHSVTGLTPGTSYTLYWAGYSSSAGAQQLLMAYDPGGTHSSAPSIGASVGGPATMEVWAV